MTNLPNPPWKLTGAFMAGDQRTVEVSTPEELVEHLDMLLSLSPTTEVIITRPLEAATS